MALQPGCATSAFQLNLIAQWCAASHLCTTKNILKLTNGNIIRRLCGASAAEQTFLPLPTSKNIVSCYGSDVKCCTFLKKRTCCLLLLPPSCRRAWLN